MKPKTLLAVLLAMLCFTACKKNNNSDADTIILKPLSISGNIVTLNWSKLNNNSLLSYTIIRVLDSANFQAGYVARTVDKNTTQFVDTLPVAPYVQYYVQAQLSSTPPTITSNKEIYVRTDLNFIDIGFTDVLYDKPTKQLYAYTNYGTFMTYDLQTQKVVNTAVTNTSIGLCDLGIYNGRKELYVPRHDGWVVIYDATTLKQTDQIKIGNSSPQQVIYNNGILYVLTEVSVDTPYAQNFLYTYAYRRDTKSMISQSNDLQSAFLRKIPNTNSEFYAIYNQTGVFHLKFDDTGRFISQQYSTLNTINISNFPNAILPDESLISGSSGAIVNKNLIYVTSLPHGDISYESFGVDSVNNTLYAGTNKNTIQVFPIGTYQLAKTILTKGTPGFLFYDNGNLISVSYAYYYSNFMTLPAMTYTFIEQFKVP